MTTQNTFITNTGRKLKIKKGDNPFWFTSDCVHHDAQEINKQKKFRTIEEQQLNIAEIFTFDQSWEQEREIYHANWGEWECKKFWIGVLSAPVEDMRNCSPGGLRFQDAVDLLNSEFYEVGCVLLGVNCADIRNGMARTMRSIGKPYTASPCTVSKEECEASRINTMFRIENNQTMSMEHYAY